MYADLKNYVIFCTILYLIYVNWVCKYHSHTNAKMPCEHRNLIFSTIPLISSCCLSEASFAFIQAELLQWSILKMPFAQTV
jgi:hypothetical protein